MLDRKAAQRIVDALLLDARKLPGAETRVRLEVERAANTRFARGAITSTGDSDDAVVTVEVAFGKRHAGATTNQLDAASLRAALDRAARLARIAPEDPELMPALGPQTYLREAAIYDAATAAADAALRAQAAAQAIAAAKAKGLELAGFYEHMTRATLLGSSAGARAFSTRTDVGLTMTARTDDGTGSGWAGAQATHTAEIDPAALAAVAVDKAARSQKPRKLEPGRYTVILEPAAVAGLLGFLIFELNARTADEGRSFFGKAGGGTKVGVKLFPDGITLTSDPTDPATPGAPFDDEGFPLKPMTWIDRGVLAALPYSRYWAAKQGKAATGFPNGWHLHGGAAASVAELVKGTTRGVLVTHFFYIRTVDRQTLLATGLTRDGVFLVENGEIVAPVNNFRFNESPVTVLANAEALTKETVRSPDNPGLRVPAIRTAGFNLASISEAV